MIRALLDDGLSVLSDLLQSGAGSCHPETEARLNRLSQDWEDAGLHTGAKLLSQLAQALEQRRHGGGADSLKLMEHTAAAARYIRFCQQKYGLDAAGERLCQTSEEDEEQEDFDHETDS